MKDETTKTNFLDDIYKDMKDEDILIIENKIKIAHSKKFKVHILLKNKKGWRNGFVKKITPDFFIFSDSVNGEEAFFFLEIQDVEPYIIEDIGGAR